MHTRMLTTHELIDLAKQALAVRHQLTLPMSDYRLADLMDVPEGTMSNWRRGKSVIGTERAQSFADATGLPVEYIYACLEHERSNSTEVKGILQTIAGQFYPAATVAPSILLALLVLTAAPNLVMADTIAGYHAVSDNAPSMYYMRFNNTRKRRLADPLTR